jgi:type II secretion system protein H
LPHELRRRAAFTLIEMIAVVAIFALLAAFVAPNLGILSSRRLEQEAQRLSGQLELARQRTVVTGIPHRLAIDLDRGSYWLNGRPRTPRRSASPKRRRFDLLDPRRS